MRLVSTCQSVHQLVHETSTAVFRSSRPWLPSKLPRSLKRHSVPCFLVAVSSSTSSDAASHTVQGFSLNDFQLICHKHLTFPHTLWVRLSFSCSRLVDGLLTVPLVTWPSTIHRVALFRWHYFLSFTGAYISHRSQVPISPCSEDIILKLWEKMLIFIKDNIT